MKFLNVKKIGSFERWFVVWGFWAVLVASASAQSVRIAVVGDPALADLVDAATAGLSSDPALEVLDRADLDKLGQEQALQAVIAAKDFSAVHLVPADGLVLLRAVNQDGKPGVFARLVAVQPGVVLREVALPSGADPLAQAQALEKEFAPYWSKLGAIQKGGIKALSLLGLRFEVDAPETRDLERSFNILLASRLGAEPNVLVLERWRLNDAAFEKTVNPQEPSAFWTGSSLIDGSMRWDKSSDSIEVKLRLRPPQGAEISVEDRDTSQNLPALVERLADKIRNGPAEPANWKPADEASHFAGLGKWCLDNRLFDEGAEALESALALGDTSRTTHMLQVKAYALEAYPDDLYGIYIAADNFRVAKLDPASMPARVAAATRAAQLAREYLKANANFKPGQKWDPEDPVDLSVKTLNTTLRILCAAYENDFLNTHPDEMAALRHAIQPLMADLASVIPTYVSNSVAGAHHAFVDYRAYYAGLWQDRPEDTLAFYRQALRAGGDDGVWVREQIFQPTPPRQPFLDEDDGVLGKTSSWMRLAPPWIVAWDGRTPDQMKLLWQSFIQQLASSPDLLDQCDAMKFEVCSSQTEAGRDAVGIRFVDFLQKHPEILSGPQKEEFCEEVQALLGTLGQKTTEYLRPAVVQLNVDLMRQHVLLTGNWIQAMTDFVYGPYSDEAAPKLLAALNDYGAWYGKQTPRDSSVVRVIDQLRDTIYRAKTGLAPAAAPTSEVLTISRFWKPEHVEGEESSGNWVLIDPRTLALEGKTAWVMTLFHPGKIIGFDTSTMQMVQTVPIPPDLVPRQHTSRAHHRYLEATPDWIAVGAESMALLYSRSGGQWTKLDVPATCYRPRWTGGQLYLLYDAERGDRVTPLFADDPTAAGSGVIRVSLPGDSCENLVSSRRIPPQNALDGRPLGEPIDIWASTGGLRLSFYDQPIYTTPAEKNDWTPVADIPPVRRGKVTSSGFLVEEGFSGLHYGELVLHGDGPGKVLLSDEGDAEWNFPKGGDSNLMEKAMLFSCPILRGHDLCIFALLRADPMQSEQPYLIYFAEGQRGGLRIPLSFDYTVINDPALNKARPLSISFDALQPADNGVLIPEFTHRGYWLLPWADIDAYRAKAQPATASAGGHE